jgi:Protein of unknown function (DUF1573)
MKKVIIALCLSMAVIGANAQGVQTAHSNNTTNATAPAKQPTPATSVPISANPAATTSGTNAPAQVDPKAGKFKFDEETHDFGEVMEGPLAEYDFEFKNVGKSPIVISEAHGSCGCTVPKWPTEPILPKHKGIIHVSYNTSGRVGQINKDVFITSNAQQNPMKLHITGTVKPKPAENKPAAPTPPPPPPAK